MKKVVAISEQARDAIYMRGAAEVYAERAKRAFDEVIAAAAQADPQRAMKTLEAVLGTLEIAKDALDGTRTVPERYPEETEIENLLPQEAVITQELENLLKQGEGQP